MSVAERLDDPGPEYSELLCRKVSTFGLAVTVEEVKEVLQRTCGLGQYEGELRGQQDREPAHP